MNTTSSTTKDKKGKPQKLIDQKITTELIDKITDQDLIQYSFWQDFNDKSEKNKSMYFDTVSEIPITSMGQFDNQKAIGQRSTRWITFNIPAIDALSRSNPFVKKAVNYLSSKPLINSIDINTLRNELSSEELFLVQNKLQSQYRANKEVLSKGHTYGGSAGLLWIEGQVSEEELVKPLDIKKIKKNSFLGIKPLARWFQIEPSLDKDLITKVGEGTGFYNANVIGMPMYYNVSLSGGLAGDKSRKEMVVHASRLLLFNAELPSFIETQIERYWGPSIVELAWNELAKDSRLWNATTKSAEKNNMAVMKIKGLALAGTVNQNVKNRISARMSLIKDGSANNVLPIDADDSFDFVSSVLSGQKDIIELSNSRLAGAFKVPVSVLFPTNSGDDADKSYIQSLSELQDLQDRILRQWYDVLLPVIIKSEVGRYVNPVMYSFNPIETLTTKEKAEVAKINMETLDYAYQNGFIDKASGIKLMDDISKSPEHFSQSINETYRNSILERAEAGEFITANSDKIELAEALNQMNPQGSGVSGVDNPKSGEGGKEGGNPKKSKGVFKRNPLNPQKGKE